MKDESEDKRSLSFVHPSSFILPVAGTLDRDPEGERGGPGRGSLPGGLIEGEVVETGVLEVDDALTADADKVVMVVEVGVEAGLLIADVDARDEVVALEQRQGAVDRAARQRRNRGLRR